VFFHSLQTKCYVGDHLVVACFSALLLIFYTLGFPFFCFTLLMRAFADQHSQRGALGWLRTNVPFLRGRLPPRLRSSIIADKRRSKLTLMEDDSAANEPPLSPSRQVWMREHASDPLSSCQVRPASTENVASSGEPSSSPLLDAESLLLLLRELKRHRKNAYGKIMHTLKQEDSEEGCRGCLLVLFF
jgi:hypothetical protein